MKVLVWGAKLKARLLLNLLSQPESLDIKKKISFTELFDPKLKKPIFETKISFFNKKKRFKFFNKEIKIFHMLCRPK